MAALRSLPQVFLAAAARHPEKPFLFFEGTRHTYGDVLQRVARVAGALRGRGLQRGDRVALYMENRPAFVDVYLGALWLGAVVVPVNNRYRETELHHILTDSGAHLVVTDAVGAEELARLPPAPTSAVISVDAEDLASGDAIPEPAALGPDDLAMIGYTSGTTGRSKGAILTHGNFLSNSAAVTTAWGWTPDDHLLLTLPLFHMHGLGVGLHGTLVQGSTITLRRRFDARDVLETLAEGHCTMFFGVPTMYHRLVTEASACDARPRGVRLFVSGSAPLATQTLTAFESAFGKRILERYGMTETVMNLGNPLAGERKPGSVGMPFDGISARVADLTTGAPLPDGEIGEVQLKGTNLFAGYWNQPDATRDSFTADGWFKTGDLGYRDADGYFFLTGRARELIISGGFNVYPREVEELLARHPDVADAAVLGLPDADLGERVVAVVVRRSPTVRAGDLLLSMEGRLAGFKVPKEIHFVDELPRNAMGKVQKPVLRERLRP